VEGKDECECQWVMSFQLHYFSDITNITGRVGVSLVNIDPFTFDLRFPWYGSYLLLVAKKMGRRGGKTKLLAYEECLARDTRGPFLWFNSFAVDFYITQ
jgi:hypothetical protein